MIKVDWLMVGTRLGALFKILKWPLTILLVTYLLRNADEFWLGLAGLDAKLLLEYISVLRWPLIALIALLIIRPNLPGLISRIREVGFGGSKIKLDGPQGRVPTNAASLKEADENVDDPAVSLTESSSNTVEADRLEETLTSIDAKLAYEQTYRVMYGTQLKALTRLRSYSSGLKEGQLQDLYEEHKQLMGAQAYSNIVSFMQFLLDNILVRFEPQDDVYKLTNAGAYFLKYLDEQGLTHQYKAF